MAQRASISMPSPTTRPTTSASSTSAGLGGVMAGVRSGALGKRTPGGLERSQSTYQISSLASSTVTSATNYPSAWTLAIYKQKADTEPIVKYAIQRIASCYVGDVASHKKKSLVQPTLVVNLRNEPQQTNISSRSFRRRSSDAPPRDGFRKDVSGSTILFRLCPEMSTSTLEKWSKEIQTQLLHGPSSLQKPSPIEFSQNPLRETFQERSDYDTLAPSPPPLFLVNGEPNTALLSPSIRSRTSNLSSVDSGEDMISYSSSSFTALDIIRPAVLEDQRRPHSSLGENQQRPALHVKTNSPRKGSDSMSTSILSDQQSPVMTQKSETILDRFFSTSPSSPSASDLGTKGGKPMSSIARFEALMNDLESKEHDKSTTERPSTNEWIHDYVHKRIPSPTQRALEFGNIGYRRGDFINTAVETPQICDSEYLASFSSPHTPSGGLSTSISLPRSLAGNMSPSLSRRNSDAHSLDTLQSSHTATSNSTSAGTLTVDQQNTEPMCGTANLSAPSAIRRHSVAPDFSMMRISAINPPPPLLAPNDSGSFRRNSIGHISAIRELSETSPSCELPKTGRRFELGAMDCGEFGVHHPISTPKGNEGSRPLFRDFSF